MLSSPESTNRPRNILNQAAGFGLGLIPTALMTIAMLFLRDLLNTSTVALLYLIPVLLSTSLWGLWPGVFSAFAAFLAYNYFFLLPYHTFIVHESQDIIALLILLVVAVFNSQLVARARAGQAEAVERQKEATHLYELSLDLAGAGSPAEIAAVLARKTAEMVQSTHLEVSIKTIHGEQSFHLSIPDTNPPGIPADAAIPLENVRLSIGEIRIWLHDPPLAQSQERVLRAFAAQGTLAFERMALLHTETRAQVLEESDRLKSALLSSVTHELRTPLATIKAATTSLISDDIPWEAPARFDLLSVVDEEADYLNYLVGNLLDMSRIEANALKPNRHWNILSEIIDGVLERLHRIVSGFTLDIDIADDLPVVPVDYSQMEQVFVNLLTNAAKYAPHGSTIQIEAHLQDENTALISLKNEGPQVKPDDLERIFDKFNRITDPEKVSGTGLGLSICKGIIEAHGGKIWAENVPGGLVFRFTLPLRLDGNPPPQIVTEEL